MWFFVFLLDNHVTKLVDLGLVDHRVYALDLEVNYVNCPVVVRPVDSKPVPFVPLNTPVELLCLLRYLVKFLLVNVWVVVTDVYDFHRHNLANE